VGTGGQKKKTMGYCGSSSDENREKRSQHRRRHWKGSKRSGSLVWAQNIFQEDSVRSGTLATFKGDKGRRGVGEKEARKSVLPWHSQTRAERLAADFKMIWTGA